MAMRGRTGNMGMSMGTALGGWYGHASLDDWHAGDAGHLVPYTPSELKGVGM